MVPKMNNSTRCVICAATLVKNGRTAAGTQRWKCQQCGGSSVRKREDLARKHQLNEFLGWLLGKHSQQELGSATTGRTFRRRTAWCWQIRPEITITGEVYDEVQIDGIYLSSSWCCLVAITDGKVIAWQWCDREKTASWKALLDQIPPPTVVVCDGGSGLLSAVGQGWPDTKIQRCLVHVQRNARQHLTSNPRTDAGKSLWALARGLTRIQTREQAIAWLEQLNDWHKTFGHLTRHRTYRKDAPRGAAIPQHIRPGQRWWYTHERLRRAYRQLAKLAQNQHLFTYLLAELEPLKIASTTNHIEGGINAGLRELLRHHRGMPPEHQRRAIEWWLHAHALTAPKPADLIRPEHHQPKPKQPVPDEPIGPAQYDTGLTAEEGLWTRKGWAGRSH